MTATDDLKAVLQMIGLAAIGVLIYVFFWWLQHKASEIFKKKSERRQYKEFSIGKC